MNVGRESGRGEERRGVVGIGREEDKESWSEGPRSVKSIKNVRKKTRFLFHSLSVKNKNKIKTPRALINLRRK